MTAIVPCNLARASLILLACGATLFDQTLWELDLSSEGDRW